MGIARVDVWLANRYRLVAQPANDVGLPHTDFLCVDVGSLFEQNTGWTEKLARQSEEDVTLQVLKHLEFIVSVVKPQQQIFIAANGVPPMAFLQTERIKRLTNYSKLRKFFREHQCTQDEVVFNMNKITPGSEFMDKFDSHMSFFLRHKIASDPDWQAPLVFYSGSRVHGDSKFKILNFFRKHLHYGVLKSGNPSFCIYSTAPDMPLMALMTHEPHVYILRETETMKKDHIPTRLVEKHLLADFTVFHLGLLREYWKKDMLRGPFERVDLEASLEDFVIMCSMLGNDALPRIATLHTEEGGVEAMLKAYKEIVLHHGHFFEPDRQLNQGSLEAFFHALGNPHKELERLLQRIKLNDIKPKLYDLMKTSSMDILKHCGENHNPLELWKEKYYEQINERRGPQTTPGAMVQFYIRGMIWQAAYYVKGIYCWNYWYPENYGPCMSDMLDLRDFEVLFPTAADFAKTEPLSLNEYIMSVLPTSDKALVPEVLSCMMDNEKSVLKAPYEICKKLSRDFEGAWWYDDCHFRMTHFPARQLQKLFRRIPFKKLYPDLVKREEEGKILLFKYWQGCRETQFCKSTLPNSYFDVDTPHSMFFFMDGPRLEYEDEYKGFPPRIPEGRLIGKDSPAGFPSFYKSPLMIVQSEMCLEIPLDRSYERFLEPSQQCFMFFLPPVQRKWPGALNKFVDKFKFLNKAVYIFWPYLRKAFVKGISDPFGIKHVEGSTKFRTKEAHDGMVQGLIARYYYQRGIVVTQHVDIIFTVEVEGQDGVEVNEAAQAVLVKTATGKLRSVMEYLIHEDDRSQVENVCDGSDDDNQYSSQPASAPSALDSDDGLSAGKQK